MSAIGIFDSGIGGLTVAKAIEDLLPNERFIYVGDTQHMPYGDKSEERIKGYCKNIVEFLLTKKVKMIVIACNTASAVAASYLRSQYWQQVEIMGVIRPMVKTTIEGGYHHVGIIGTTGTIQSNIYPSLFKEYQSDVKIYQLATSLLAPMIESGQHQTEVAHAIIKQYMGEQAFEPCEAILLACTHYPLIKTQIDDFFQGKKKIIDNALPMAAAVKAFLQEKDLLATERNGEHEFYITEFTHNFAEVASMFYGKAIACQQLTLHAS